MEVNCMQRDFTHKKRIVVKVGSSTISYENGKLNYHRIEHLVRELADLQNQGKEMILAAGCPRWWGKSCCGCCWPCWRRTSRAPC